MAQFLVSLYKERYRKESKIADMQKDIDRQKQEAVAAVERLQRLKKEIGITD